MTSHPERFSEQVLRWFGWTAPFATESAMADLSRVLQFTKAVGRSFYG
ncbi:hypothetical protein [Paenarthrobacter sp. NPDC089316]